MYVYVYVCALACVRVYMYLHYIVSSCSMFDPTCDVFLFPTLHLSTQHSFSPALLMLRTNWLRLRLQILSWVCSAVLTAHYN